MKIVHVVRGSFSSEEMNGVYKVVDALSKSLARKGAVVSVISVGEDVPQSYDPEAYQHVHVRESRTIFGISEELKQAFRVQDRSTIFHFHSVFIPWFSRAVCFLRHNGFRHIVLTPHGQYTDVPMAKSLTKRLFFRVFDARVIRRASVVHLIGETERNDWILRRARGHVLIPNGGGALPCLPRRAPKLSFGYLGRLQADQKGLDYLLRAFARYKHRGGLGTLQIAGDGADTDSLLALRDALPCKDDVAFMGALFGSQKDDFFKSCAFFCLPSRWDVFPTAALEASSYGIPLIVSSATNLGPYIRTFNAGLVLQDRNMEDSLEQAFFKAERIYLEQSKYAVWQENSRNMIAFELNWEILAQRFIDDVYQHLA